MKQQGYKVTGISLISGSILVILTMVLHPLGGSIEHIINITTLIIVTHALAIFCLPFILFGFYGLTMKLMDESKVSVLAFLMILFGCVAAMFAALVNGLTVPYFLGKYTDRLEEHREVLNVVLNYSFAINTSLDYIFIVAFCLAIAVYAIVILRTHKLPKWMGYFGLLFIIFVIIGVLTGFVFTSLAGFRIVVFSLAAWILSAGILITRSKV
ncbi:DUF6796 family protein [uncultured Dokdonia sp.]|uniref:DUF6796 family protein n=1 Tax=uncultured Dokdonia sp. TaxID=575653 RepID=UPI002616396D|nr:DUF6796 family protein [uncultured Dokdonia sp.]